ncbi:subclass B1 metallo-beta-lactamase [Psychroserpens luteolus]|uniref:subclass B1 metallo-beta-lactamase n=1 Tax=Psychroserpens luteolus TaxID=2855840 RepID=UPI001E439D36|nr:subclass B1 metallo-beta-lactamase [Psychroserpens luteolus]MCD2258799.1 subclass B1 metallo-beta-lactamase [Psychroserpens luteolus]
MKNISLLNVFVSVIIVLGFYSCSKPDSNAVIYDTDVLSITRVNKHVFVHESYLKLKSGTEVPCNGMIFISNNEAIVLDTPTTIEASKELIEWIEETLRCEVKAVVPTHFHVDCLGGLDAFHDKGINSIANNATIKLAQRDSSVLPKSGFNNTKDISIGDNNVILSFFGEGHTRDNVVAYIPSEETLFGGCLIKTLEASKGNLNDANIDQWSTTVEQIKNRYSDLKFIVPGHGSYGDTALLDYTIELFKINDQ